VDVTHTFTTKTFKNFLKNTNLFTSQGKLLKFRGLLLCVRWYDLISHFVILENFVSQGELELQGIFWREHFQKFNLL